MPRVNIENFNFSTCPFNLYFRLLSRFNSPRVLSLFACLKPATSIANHQPEVEASTSQSKEKEKKPTD